MSDLTEGGRALVHAGRKADRPSDADRERVLVALRARLGDAAVLGAGVAQPPPAAAGVGAASSKLVKWGWVGPAVFVAAGALWFVPRIGHESEKAALAPSANVLRTVSVAAPLMPKLGSAPEVVSAAPASPEVAAVDSAPVVSTDAASRPIDAQKISSRSRDGLSEEVALLSRAETELHAGRPAKALVALAEHQRKFPRGALAEERTAARIQALCALGRNDEANAQLRQLLHISPNSALEERARQACRP